MCNKLAQITIQTVCINLYNLQKNHQGEKLKLNNYFDCYEFVLL